VQIVCHRSVEWCNRYVGWHSVAAASGGVRGPIATHLQNSGNTLIHQVVFGLLGDFGSVHKNRAVRQRQAPQSLPFQGAQLFHAVPTGDSPGGSTGWTMCSTRMASFPAFYRNPTVKVPHFAGRQGRFAGITGSPTGTQPSTHDASRGCRKVASYATPDRETQGSCCSQRNQQVAEKWQIILSPTGNPTAAVTPTGAPKWPHRCTCGLDDARVK
jgi:hypothetical protein